MTAAAAIPLEALEEPFFDAAPEPTQEDYLAAHRMPARKQQLGVAQVCMRGFRGTSCKSPICEVCGPRWAGDQRRVMEAALRKYNGPVVLTDVTPPGAERLPWACTKEHRDRNGRPLPHSGPKRGCKVQQRAAREWCDTYTLRLDHLRRAGNAYVRRHLCKCGHMRRSHEERRGACTCGGCGCSKFAGCIPNLVTRVHEPQKRGVPHWHGAFGYRTLAEKRAIKLYVAWQRTEERCACGRTKRWHDAGGACPIPTEQRSPTFGWTQLRQWDFGFNEAHLKPKSGREAARYLTSYLTGRSKHKPAMRQNIVDPAMSYWATRNASYYREPREQRPRLYRLPLVWVSPRLTSFKWQGSGLTMRTLRRTRQLFSVLNGTYLGPENEPAPNWFYEVRDALETALIFRRQRGRDNADEDAAIERVVFTTIESYEKVEPGWDKVLARRQCMSFVRDITGIKATERHLRLVPGGVVDVPVAA